MKKKNWIFSPLNANTLEITPLSKQEKHTLLVKKQTQLSKYNGQGTASTSNWIIGWRHYNDK